MENSKNSPLLEFSSILNRHLRPELKLAVALSGGCDSVVLLDILHRFAPHFPFYLSAVHVHHGLSPNADEWAKFCEQLCTPYKIPFTLCRIQLPTKPTEGWEAAARRARYQCLTEAKADVVALAHHLDDQAETVLLQLLRGAGVKGLAAMPVWRAGRPSYIRPLLGWSRQSILAYAKARDLIWIEDESNRDHRFKRNFIRLEILPLISRVFPSPTTNLARSANHLAEAQLLLADLAELDAGAPLNARKLSRQLLSTLPYRRAKNVLRQWFTENGLSPPNAGQLDAMLKQFLTARHDAQITLEHDGWSIGVQQDSISLYRPTTYYETRWAGETSLQLPHGRLVFSATRGEGIDAGKLSNAIIRPRRGGERIKSHALRPHRTLKNLFQEARIPYWERKSWPLVWHDSELVAVPGIAVNYRYQCPPNETGWSISWQPTP